MTPKCVVLVAVAGLLFAASEASPQAKSAPRRPSAQPPAAASVPDESILLTNGWALLAQGLPNDAARKAAEVVARSPRSVAALSLLVESEIARAGVHEALAAYDRWLGGRTLEEPGVLRRLAIAVLSDAARQRKDTLVRQEAIQALAEGGEAWARSELTDASSPADLRTLAAGGDQRAVAALSAQLGAESPDKLRIIEALGKSRRPGVAAAIAAQLADPREEVRAAAVDALAELRVDAYRPPLQHALQDPSSFVRTRAARALFRMGDMTGLTLLQQLATSDAPVTRLIAAEAMATAPDAGWLDLVRNLTTAPEPEVRAGAARLLAPHDPATSTRVLETLAQDPNIAIREMAARGLAESLNGDDLPALRRLLENADALTRVHAAGAILKATL